MQFSLFFLLDPILIFYVHIVTLLQGDNWVINFRGRKSISMCIHLWKGIYVLKLNNGSLLPMSTFYLYARENEDYFQGMGDWELLLGFCFICFVFKCL